MSKRTKRTAVAVDDVADDVADIGDTGSVDGAVSSAGAPAATDPTTAAPSDERIGDSPAPRRGRGRPPGSGTSQKAKPIPLNVTGLEKLLVGIHGGLAILSSRGEWSLDTESKTFDGKTEAEFLAMSIKDVADHYGNGLLDKKTLDWCNLIQCLAIVYGGRIYAIRATPRVPRAPKPDLAHRVGPAPVHHTPSPPANSFEPQRMNGESDLGTGEIAGIGAVEFPDGHPLKPKLN